MPSWQDVSLASNLAVMTGSQLSFAGTALAFFHVRNIGGFIADVTLVERHRDQMVITSHPIELGSVITDHAYKLPIQVVITVGYSNSSLNSIGQIAFGAFSVASSLFAGGSLSSINLGDFNYINAQYKNFLTLQQMAQPFSVTTGKRQLNNMLIEYIAEQTDEKTENSVILEIGLREALLVSSQSITAPSGVNSNTQSLINPQVNGQPSQQGTVQSAQVGAFPQSYLNSSGIADAALFKPAPSF